MAATCSAKWCNDGAMFRYAKDVRAGHRSRMYCLHHALLQMKKYPDSPWYMFLRGREVPLSKQEVVDTLKQHGRWKQKDEEVRMQKQGCAVCGAKAMERCEICGLWFCEDDAVMTRGGVRCRDHEHIVGATIEPGTVFLPPARPADL